MLCHSYESFTLKLVFSPNQTGPYVQRIYQHLNRMSQAKAELLDDTSRKRPAVAPPVTQTTDSVKRQKFENATILPLPPLPFTGPPTYANLFTLTRDAALTNFDAQILPIDLVIQITLATFYSVTQQTLDTAIQVIGLCF